MKASGHCSLTTKLIDAAGDAHALRVGDPDRSDARFAECGHGEPELVALEFFVTELGL